MEIVEIKAQLIEQLRDIFFGRETYNDTEEWVDNVSVCIEEICQETDMMTMQMGYDKKKRETAAQSIGQIVISDLEKAKVMAEIYGGKDDDV